MKTTYAWHTTGGAMMHSAAPAKHRKFPMDFGMPDQRKEHAKNNSALNTQEGGSHYKDLNIQPIEYAMENGLDYCQANVVKYVTRHESKNGIEDIRKAIHNLRILAEMKYPDQEL